MADASFEDELALITQAAAEAGRIAMGFFGSDPKMWLKAGESPVSEADLAVDAYLRRTLLGERPAYGWLSEETAREAATGGEQRFFVVDPIDGTRAFLRGSTTWCISIAVIDRGRPVAGVLDAPALGEVFTASADGGAFLGGVPIAVSAPHGEPLRVSMPDTFRQRLSAEHIDRLELHKSAPSLAYRLAEVACGRLDGTLIRPSANDWDIAAGDLILCRAGGALVDTSGASSLYKIEGKRHGVLLAGAGHALPALSDLVTAARRE